MNNLNSTHQKQLNCDAPFLEDEEFLISDETTPIWNGKTVSTHFSLLGGKVGRTWYGFLCDWAATLGFSKSPEFAGKSFKQRWKTTQEAPLTTTSVKDNCTHPRIFLTMMMNLAKTHLTQQAQLDIVFLEHHIKQMSNATLKTHIDALETRVADLVNHVDLKKEIALLKSENEYLMERISDLEMDLQTIKPQIEESDKKSKHSSMFDMLNQMTGFIKKSHFNHMLESKLPMGSLERAQLNIYQGTCQLIAQLTVEINHFNNGEKNLEAITSLQDKIVEGMNSYQDLRLRRAAVGVGGILKAIKKWKALSKEGKAKRKSEYDAKSQGKQPIMSKPAFLSSIENLNAMKLLKRVKQAEELELSSDFSQENDNLKAKASAFNTIPRIKPSDLQNGLKKLQASIENSSPSAQSTAFAPKMSLSMVDELKTFKFKKPNEKASVTKKPLPTSNENSVKSELEKAFARMQGKLNYDIDDNASETSDVEF